MKPHPRPPIIRKTIKWGGAVVTVLLVVVWIGSGWWMVVWASSSHDTVNMNRGCVYVAWNPAIIGKPFPPGWHLYQSAPVMFNWKGSWRGSSLSGSLVLPLWVPALAAGLLMLLAWRLDILARRRARLTPYLCPTCNYDRTGLAADAKCPECGAVPVSV